ncbi:MAG: glutathione S-transferase [Pseudomonadota bacterium]
MKLFYAAASPYVRKVMITAHELGLADRIETVTAPTSPLDPNADLLAVNPVGKIPALVTEDAGTLFDSRVICRYLNHVGGGSLYGSGAGEYPIIGREALAEGMIDAMLLAVYERRLRSEDMVSEPWVIGQMAKAKRGMADFDHRVGELGGDVTIDKIALGAALGYADFRHGNLGWRADCPKLADWYEAFLERPSMQATMPSG